MVTGLGFGDMNLTICEGVPCCLMTMAPPTPPTHTRARAMKHKWGTEDIARFCEVDHTTILTYTGTHSFPSLLLPSRPLLPSLITPLTPCQPLLLSCLSCPLALPLPCLPYVLAMASSA